MKTHSLVCFLAAIALGLGVRTGAAQVLAQYGFENNVIDTSGNGHNGTNFNVGYTTGIIGASSGTFNGTSSYVDLGDNTMTSTLKPALPITVTAWVCLGSTNACRIFSGDNSDDSSVDSMMAGYDLGISTGGLPECDFGDAGGWGSGHRQSLSGTVPLAVGQWYHLAAVIQGASNMQLYVNGQLINGNYSGMGGAMQYTTAPSRIGTGHTGAFFNGNLDDVRVYHAALTQTQIAQIAVGALGYWAFEEGTGTTTADATGDGFTGTLTNGPQWTTGLDGSALAFNGTNFVNFGNTSTNNVLKQALPISISGLVYLNSTNGAQRIFSGDNTDDTSIIAGYDISVINGQLVAEFADAGGAYSGHRRTNTGTIALATGQWYNLSAVIQNATNIALYVNGVNATGANSGTGGSIGYTGASSKAATSGTTTFLNGKLQDIGVYNAAITPFQAGQAETIGGGTTNSPAVGPPPSFGIGGPGFTLVKNWHFGTDGTITNTATLDANFQYHDEFGTINNGGNYGANTVSTDTTTRLVGSGQFYVGESDNGVPVPQVRAFTADSMQTYLVPLGGTGTITPAQHNCGCGSFQPIWTLPAGGSNLGQDILWETRVRYFTPPYFWFALWVDGSPVGSNYAPEIDLLESFGYNNTGTFTNYDGRFWHSNTVSNGTNDFVNYQPKVDWQYGMQSVGINSYDATKYHIWTLLYRKDNSYVMYVDGTPVQWGPSYYWTLNNVATGTSVPMCFRYDAGLGATNVSDVDFPTLPSALNTNSVYYEFNYSRVYLR